MISYIFGALLCVAMVAIIVYFFSPKIKDRIEKPKYDMLDDDGDREKQN